MALKTFVKVSTVNNLSDARYCAGMYVNWLGFNLEESSPDYLSPEKFTEITEWLSGLEYVGEFENSHPDTIRYPLHPNPGRSPCANAFKYRFYHYTEATYTGQ
jgi:phosphoribosylanthranilate isomerase